MDVKQTLERLVPETERLPSWDGVLRDARPSRARWAAPRLAVLGAVIGLAALLAFAPWRSGERTGVLERALAAAGDGPVFHVAFRNEERGTLIDLKTGKGEPIYRESEFWFDPERGISFIGRLGGAVQHRDTGPPLSVERQIGVLASGYREALESGTARLAGEGVVDGIPVYWIQVTRDHVSEVGDGKVHEVAQEVAVARDTYKAVYVRETRDGVPVESSGRRVLVAENLPAGSGDFAPSPAGVPRLGLGSVFGVSPDPISREEAADILGRKTAWLGAEWEGRRLAKIGRLTMRSEDDELMGVSFLYGSLTKDGELDVTKPGITIQQAPRRHPSLERGVWNYPIPEGSVAVIERHAFLHYQGTFVAIRAWPVSKSGDVLLAAARALRPLSAGSGAGG
jgi:hypothetical protein